MAGYRMNVTFTFYLHDFLRSKGTDRGDNSKKKKKCKGGQFGKHDCPEVMFS